MLLFKIRPAMKTFAEAVALTVSMTLNDVMVIIAPTSVDTLRCEHEI